jgi:hypothetical protein
MAVTKTSLLKVLREVLDADLRALGFRWSRMWRSSDGHYVRRWAAGKETLGVGIVTYHPEYKLSPYVTTMLDPVAELVCPFLGFVEAGAAKDFSDHVFNLSPFIKGPPGDLYYEHVVTTEDEARQAAKEIGNVVRTAVDPWLLQHRSPAAMFELVHSPWRDCAPLDDPLRGMVEVALAYLCSSPEEQRLRSETMARIAGWPVEERTKVEKLTAELDRRRES